MTIKAIFVNYFLLVPFTLWVSYALTGEVMFDMRFEGLADGWTMFKQIAFCYLIEDTVFYFAHRALHTKFFMRNIHYIYH